MSCCRKVSGEITARHDIVVNIFLNNILVQRGLITMNRGGKPERKFRLPETRGP